MSARVPQAPTPAEIRANLPDGINEALDLLTEAERDVYVQMYGNPQVTNTLVHPAVISAAQKAQAVLDAQKETARLVAQHAEEQAAQRVAQQAAQQAQQATNEAMDRETRKRFINDMCSIANYKGEITEDGARR